MNVKFIRVFLQAAQIRDSLRFGADGYLDLAPRKLLLFLFIEIFTSSQGKLSLQLVTLPGA